MLLPRAVLMTCLVCTCSDADAFPPYPQISWEAPVEKKAECIQKGKSNQVGSLGPAGGRGVHDARSFCSVPVLVWVPGSLCSRHSE